MLAAMNSSIRLDKRELILAKGSQVMTRRGYHSGDTPEVAHMLKLLAARYRQIYAVGVSLGGNVLAKYLGEQGRL